MQIAIDIQAVAETRTGVGQFTYHLVKALAGADSPDRYTLFLFDFRRRFRDLSLEQENVRVQKIRLPGMLLRKIWDRAPWPPMERLTGPFDLFHFTNYLVPPLRGGRALTTIYDLGFLRHPGYADPKALKALSRNLRKSVERAAGVITVSEFSKSEIMDLLGLPDSMIEVVYPGVSPAISGPVAESAIRRVRRKYGLSGPYIVHVGTIEPRKNIPVLLKAFAEDLPFFRARGCRLLLAGKRGWLYDEVFDTVRARGLEGDVVFAGYVGDDELALLYRAAEFAVFPSFYEGFGIPLLEAMASAIPVLASDIEAHKEVLGEAALFFDPQDSEGLARRMKELYEDRQLREALTGKGDARASRFTWEASAARMARVYRRFGRESA